VSNFFGIVSNILRQLGPISSINRI